MSVRLHVDPDRLEPGEATVTGEDFHYLVRVRRLRPGDPVVLFDGAGREADARLASSGDREARLEVGPVRSAARSGGPRLEVALSVVKGDRTEWAIQKLVELGVGAVHPVEAARSVVKLRGSRADSRLRRYRTVAREAARQSHNPTIPRIGEVAPLPAALAALAGADLKLLLWERVPDRPLRDALPRAVPERAAILVGPEGGFTGAEAEAAVDAGFVAVGLGPRILRAETAAVATAAILQHVFGDLG